jgi:hypothetical protein
VACSLVSLGSLVRESRGHSRAARCSSFFAKVGNAGAAVLDLRRKACVAPRQRGPSANTRQQKKAGGCGGWREEGKKNKGLAGAGPLAVFCFLRRCALLGSPKLLDK